MQRLKKPVSIKKTESREAETQQAEEAAPLSVQIKRCDETGENISLLETVKHLF